MSDVITTTTNHLGKTPAPAPSTLSSYTATIVNNSSATLTLKSSTTNMQWTQPPPQTINAGGQGVFSSPGDFSNPAAGDVTYIDTNGGSITITWDIPSVGPNAIRWSQQGDLSMSQSGSTSGWNLTNFFTVQGG
jgi:hypothetical protein